MVLESKNIYPLSIMILCFVLGCSNSTDEGAVPVEKTPTEVVPVLSKAIWPLSDHNSLQLIILQKINRDRFFPIFK